MVAHAVVDTRANTLPEGKAEILLVTLSDVESKTMVDKLAHTVAEHALGSVKIEKLINSFANKLGGLETRALDSD